MPTDVKLNFQFNGIGLKSIGERDFMLRCKIVGKNSKYQIFYWGRKKCISQKRDDIKIRMKFCDVDNC